MSLAKLTFILFGRSELENLHININCFADVNCVNAKSLNKCQFEKNQARFNGTYFIILPLVVSVVTFVSARTNVMQGAVHIALFLGYVMLIFDKT